MSTLIQHFLFGLQPRWRTCWSLIVSCPPTTVTSPARWGSSPTLSFSSPTGVSHWTTWLTHLGSPMSSLTSECNFIVMKSFPIPYEVTWDNTLMQNFTEFFFNHVYDILFWNLLCTVLMICFINIQRNLTEKEVNIWYFKRNYW